MSLEYILINWRIALTEVKHPLLGKRQALSNSLNAAPVHISFCLSCNQRGGHFHESYERQTSLPIAENVKSYLFNDTSKFREFTAKSEGGVNDFSNSE